MKGTAVFVDTTIQIARIVHHPQIKARIRERLDQYDVVVTGTVVRQEFRHRLLRDAKYLLGQFDIRKSYTAVIQHVQQVLGLDRRKQAICLSTLTSLFPGTSEADLTDRAKLLLKHLLEDGMDEFNEGVDSVVKDLGCGCSCQPIKNLNGTYEFGTDKCSKANSCGIVKFLRENSTALNSILDYLRKISTKSKELSNAERFLETILASPAGAPDFEPCLNVGDLLIALESMNIENFYTMNGKESQHLCRSLSQSLILRPMHYEKPDSHFAKSDQEWNLAGDK